MINNLFFGVAYYPEYMPYERIEKDFAMMKYAGMNTVRIAESTWSTLEPQENVFDFSYIDKVLEEAQKRDIYVIIGMPTYAVPSWLVKKDKNVLATTIKGQAHYGRRQIMNIMNRTYRQCSEKIIRTIMNHVAGHPNVVGFQIDNETKHYGTISEDVQKEFIDYLKGEFQTTEALNRSFNLAYWSNSIARWEDFPDMRGCVNGGLAGELAAFQRKLASDFLHWQADIVKEYMRKDQFITHNLDFEWKKFGAAIAQDGYSYGVQPDMNHYNAAKYLTLAGTDIYHPTQDELTGAEIAYGGDSIRSLKNQTYLVLECQAQAFKYWTPYPGQLRLQAYSHLASGACGILYWNWHSIHNGYETYWKGLLSHDLESNPAYEEACRIGEEWKYYGKRLCIEKKNEIAILVDNRTLTALQWFPIDRDLSYNDIVRWMYDSLYEMNLECDVVDVNGLDSEQYKMIVTPALYCVSEETLHVLEDFVKKGGVLISTFKSFVADIHSNVYHDLQPHYLHTCFGMSYNQFSNPGKTTVKGKKIRYFMELLNIGEAKALAYYEHKYWGKYAAITSNSYGDGKAYYIGCFTEKEMLKEIYAAAAKDAGIKIYAKELQWPVTVRSGKNTSGKSVHYLFNYSEERKQLSCPWYNVVDIVSGKQYHNGDYLILNDWDVAVLEEKVL